MNFLPDLYRPLPRLRRPALQPADARGAAIAGKSIADVLDMPVDEAAAFFENFPRSTALLESLQRRRPRLSVASANPSTTLSGGEAQRIKLATELARVDTGQTLYMLDEPTTGLHFDDIRLLLGVLQRLSTGATR